ncbi:MAG: hypothetical protein H7A46_05505 [Verrucomicrobiales bacterium]|nr:hypothetical protein [Verrucomicrobiales bacterium]
MKANRLKTVGLAVAGLVVMLVNAPAAHAVASLRLTSIAPDGSTQTITIVDGDALDTYKAIDGVITYHGTVGVWTINVTTGLTKPVSGSASYPGMDLNTINSNIGVQGAGDLIIEFSDTDFTASSWSSFVNAVGGTTSFTSGSLAFDTYYSTGNGLFETSLGTSQLITSQSFAIPGTKTVTEFAGSEHGGPVPSSSPFSLTIVATIHHDAAGVTSFDDFLTVPEGGSTLALLGAGICLIGLSARGRERE